MGGFAQAALLLTVGLGLFWGLFAFVQRASGMGSGYYAPHKPDPGPIDRDQVRKFVNSPSPPPLDLGVRGASFPHSDSSSDYGSSGWQE